MDKMSKPVLVISFLFLFALDFIIIVLIRTFFKTIIEMAELQYYLICGVIAIVSFITGSRFVSLQKCWNIEEFASRIENTRTANQLILSLDVRKHEINDGMPDFVKVIITGNEQFPKKGK